MVCRPFTLAMDSSVVRGRVLFLHFSFAFEHTDKTNLHSLENENFAEALTKAGITFVGPTVSNLTTFGNKATARQVAINCDVPVVPGSEEAFATVQAARDWIDDPANNCSYPVIVKALMVSLRKPPCPVDGLGCDGCLF